MAGLPVPPQPGQAGLLAHLSKVYEFVNDAPVAADIAETVGKVDTAGTVTEALEEEAAARNEAIGNATSGIVDDVDVRVSAVEGGFDDLDRQRVLGLFAPKTGQVGIVREDRAGRSAYWLLMPQGRGRYAAVELRHTVGEAGVRAAHSIDLVASRVAATNMDSEDTATTGAWTLVTTAQAYGGSYRYATVAGRRRTGVSPAGVTRVGLRAPRIGNGGFARIFIDGDPTRATLLPTAQQAVNAGELPSSALTTNGGNLAPTDRVLNQFETPGANDRTTWFADDLTPGAHEVVVEATGYQQAGSNGNRTFVAGLAWSTDSQQLGDVGVTLQPAAQADHYISGVTSVYEYALTLVPTGGTSASGFIGNRHDEDGEVSLTIAVDGVTVTPSAGTPVLGSRITVTRESEFFHADVGSGSTPIADVVTTYTVDRNGLRVEWQPFWLHDGVARRSYSPMLPVNNGHDRAAFAVGPGDVQVASSDGSQHPGGASDLAYVWQSTGKLGAMLYVPDLGRIDHWQHVGDRALYTFVQDRLNSPLRKVYWTRADNDITEPFTLGRKWKPSVGLYRFGWFDQGANMVLARA